jgi:GNAT superfamily N-acetyltransferase
MALKKSARPVRVISPVDVCRGRGYSRAVAPGSDTSAPAAVRKARPDEVDALAWTLARAFYDDPAIMWLVPDDRRRLAVGQRGFALFLRRLWLAHDETYVADDVAGVCVWEPPGTWKVGLGTQLALLPAMLRVYGRGLPRVLGALTAIERNHPAEPHHYLAFVGVEPERQGRGVGSAIMRPVLDRCDAEGTPAYLEASSPRSRELYLRHGFEVTEELHIGRGSPPIWRMWRAART